MIYVYDQLKVTDEFRALNKQQQYFVVQFVAKRFDVEAAIKACGMPYCIGKQKFLENPAVRRCLFRIDRIYSDDRLLGPGDVLQETAWLATSNIRDVLDWEQLNYTINSKGELQISGGLKIRPASELKRSVTACIKKVKQTKDGAIEIELYDKLSALQLYAKFTGMENSVENATDMAQALSKALSDLERSSSGDMEDDEDDIFN